MSTKKKRQKRPLVFEGLKIDPDTKRDAIKAAKAQGLGDRRGRGRTTVLRHWIRLGKSIDPNAERMELTKS